MTPGNPLNTQHAVHGYLNSVRIGGKSRATLGFVFVETDRKCHLNDDSGWKSPLEEFAFVYNAGMGKDPRYQDVAGSVLGIVPWAPIPSGRAVMGRYLDAIRGIAEEGGGKIKLLKGFRYILQFCEPGTGLKKEFIEGLKLMGEEGYIFELMVDTRSMGVWQLGKHWRRYGKPTMGPLAKPDLHIPPHQVPTNQTFLSWKAYLASIAILPNTYIKLSGCFSELPPSLLSPTTSTPREEIVGNAIKYITHWTNTVFEPFGAKRVIWGSDWPVCTVNGPKEYAWGLWVDVTEGILRGLNEGEKEDV
ncbi:hypothetical protein L873DRAFT_1839237 [Choiromyces venosus 120613-1]|uniref:Amidohydrolase-related domain-containing protein n=1 Tax=Choiromyces venosus 120613-1 TaxID=1336337 RepID=A0A3N4IUG2_9PEZI|nr:hypothetical protein L873DRAFT_1839237 [Choiromyces venosus 120613-1]